jgi:hypothetical protein
VHDGGQGRTGRITIRTGAPLVLVSVAAGSGAGTSRTVTGLGRAGSHSGLSVLVTNRMATATVTVCAKISHNLRMKDRIDETRTTGGVSG